MPAPVTFGTPKERYVTVSLVAAKDIPVTPTIITQPLPFTVVLGAAASMTVVATGNPTLTYQWYKNGVIMAGKTAATLTIATTILGDIANYFVRVSNGVDVVQSATVAGDVQYAPVISSQPVDTEVGVNTPSSFTVVAAGNPALLTYQWFKDGVAMSGKTAATLSFALTQLTDIADYHCVVTNAVGSTTSATASLMAGVLAAPTFVVEPGANITGVVDGVVNLVTSAIGYPTPTYQWSKNGTPLVGETGATLNIPVATIGDTGTYVCVATNSEGFDTTASIGLIVYAGQILHIVMIGQSNAVGSQATPLYTTAPVTGGLMFNGGLKPGAGFGNLASFLPLQEAIDGTAGETGAAAMVAWLKANTVGNTDFLVSNVAVDGYRYDQLKKGQPAHSAAIAHVTAGKDLATLASKAYRVLCCVGVHGESDDAFGVLAYRAGLAEWQADCDTDFKAITGQSEDVLHFHAQCKNPAKTYNSADFAKSGALNQYAAHFDNPGLVILATPEFPFDFSYSDPHFTAYCHAWMGELFAKVIKQVCFDAEPFSPIYPLSASVAGSQIVLDLAVPVPPLQKNYKYAIYSPECGFVFDSSAGSVKPINVSISGPSQLTLTFAAPLSGTSKRISYGVDNLANKVGRSTPFTDSDVSASNIGIPLVNWMPQWALTLP